jgi:hypothetical protein
MNDAALQNANPAISGAEERHAKVHFIGGDTAPCTQID